MFEKLKSFFSNTTTGSKASLETLHFMWQHKTYFLFPFLKVIGICLSLFTIILTGCFIAFADKGFMFFTHLHAEGASISLNGTTITLLVLLFPLAALLLTFSGVVIEGMTHFYTDALLNEQPISLWQSVKLTLKKTGTLIGWSIISLIVYIFTSQRDKKQSSFVTTLLWFASLSWYMVTFFVMPLMLSDNKGIFASLKESYTLMKDNFGLNTGALVTFSVLKSGTLLTIQLLIFLGLMSVAIITHPVLFYYLVNLIKSFFTTTSTYSDTSIPLTHRDTQALITTLFMIIPITLYFSSIFSTAKTIFKTATYRSLKGNTTGPFSNVLIKDAVANQ